MNLLIISSAPFIYKDHLIYAYSPYVIELLIWDKYADSISFFFFFWESENDLLVEKIPF